MECPEGKEKPGACETGSGRCGRARSTTFFTSRPTSPPAVAVTAAQAASR